MGNDRNTWDQSTLLAQAEEAVGFDRWGDKGFQEPLQVLLADLAEAPLSDMGTMILRGGVLKSLTMRLRSNYWFDRHPEITDEQIVSPLVVVGMMRSGTTLIQRLLARDPQHYSVLGWEVGEVAPRRDVDWALPDPRIADAETRDQQTATWFPQLMAIHPSAAHEAEEEIMFLADAFLSHVHEASCNVPRYRTWLNDQDFAPAYLHLHRTLQLLQWQKKQRGLDCQRWVLKTPAHLGYLDVLLAQFPNAHVIHMHRNPVDTIPSGASLNTTLWKMHTDQVDPAVVGSQWIERMAWTNGRAMKTRAALGDDARFTDVWFTDAVQAPLAAVEQIYARAGLVLASETRHGMESWLKNNVATKQPKHRYTADQFGLSNDQIADVFSSYIDRWITPHASAQEPNAQAD